jgi:hypothetical protein
MTLPTNDDGLGSRPLMVYRSSIELRSLSFGYAAWWYSLITPTTTDLRRMVR